jgi:pantoate kinase
MFGEAFSPSGISSFFEVCTREKNGTTISDPVKVGARGGGFALSKGVTTGIYVEESDVKDIEVFINNSQTWKAKTTETTIELILRSLEKQYKIKVEHAVEVPIGAGFGTSAAGAFSCGLALSHALRLPLTYNQIARIAHMAEVMCNTGLGTVEGLTIGGLVLVIESGAMGIGLVDRIPIDPNLKIVAGVFKSMDKASVIQSSETVQKINKIARKTLKSILHEPTPKNFLRSCKNFALDSGLASKRVIKLIEDVEEAGAIGATQNMIGEAVHALTTREFLDDVHSVFAKHLPEERIVVSDIDFQGARLR